MTCPFKVGDRVHEVRSFWVLSNRDDIENHPPRFDWEPDPTKPDATVTALTSRGFTYRYDRPIQFVRPDWGTTQEGEVYEEGFHMWRKVEGRDTPLARIKALVACYGLSYYFNPGGAEFWSNAHPELPHCQISAQDDEDDYGWLVEWIGEHRATLERAPS